MDRTDSYKHSPDVSLALYFSLFTNDDDNEIIMNNSVSSFFSRDKFLKRQARPSHSRKISSAMNTSLNGKSLHIIVEEDEPRISSSSSRSPSPLYSPSSSPGGSQTLGPKSKRRHANLTTSDIRIPRTVIYANEQPTDVNERLLSIPRPAPRPATNTSPDAFNVTFTDLSYKFPIPPVPTPSMSEFRGGSISPTPSMSTSPTSSPCSLKLGLPKTPSSSDDDEHLRFFNPRRASIRPLVITKTTPSSSPSDDSPISRMVSNPSPVSKFDNLPSALSLSSSEDEATESDPESDSEWYTKEFSKILTLSSPLPPSFPTSPSSRPESTYITSTRPADSSLSVSSDFTPQSPNAQLDPKFPHHKRRASFRQSMLLRHSPPPPVPTIPAHLRSSSIVDVPMSPNSSPSSSAASTPNSSPEKPLRRRVSPPSLSLCRPPPRSSLPADCVFPVDISDDEDASSTFSLSLYEDSTSPTSIYSQPSPMPSSPPSTAASSVAGIAPASANSTLSSFSFPSEGQDVHFDIDFDLDIEVEQGDEDGSRMILPLSLPTSPIDLEGDIAREIQQQEQERDYQEVVYHQRKAAPVVTLTAPSGGEERVLRSKWSSSTLSSVREEKNAKSRLRLYFGGSSKRGSGSAKKAASAGRVTSSGTVIIPSTPMTPATPRTPLSPPMPMSPSKRYRHVRRESDAMAFGIALQQHRRQRGSTSASPRKGDQTQGGMRRKPSVTASVSDAGSDESVASSASGWSSSGSGLRRKPIPVEMFLRQ